MSRRLTEHLSPSVKKILKRIYGTLFFKTMQGLEGPIHFKGIQGSFRMLLPSDFQSLKRLWTDNRDAQPAFVRGINTYEEFMRPETSYLGLFGGDNLIAYGKLKLRGYKCVELGVSVSKPFRRRGIANVLLERFERYCEMKKIAYFAITDKRNIGARALFEKRGYVIFKTEDPYLYLAKQGAI